MWTLLVRVPRQEPYEYILQPGRNMIGRKSDNEITIDDPSASRLHAEIDLDSQTNIATLQDNGSTNGTFVNREQINEPFRLNNNDIIRIGGTTMDVSRTVTGEFVQGDSGSRIFSRELVLESLDRYAVLMYEVAEELNFVFDIDSTLNKVSELIQKAMGADRCEVILAENFPQILEMGFPSTIADEAISQKSAIIVQDFGSSPYHEKGVSTHLLRIQSVLCVPIVAEKDVLGLIYMYTYQPSGRPFTTNDLHLAVTISHQASLTLQRMNLLGKVREEQRIREFFERFISPTEVQNLVKDYIHNGYLPGLIEKEVAILFADIAHSTNLAERLGAQKFGEILNRYYWDVTDSVFSNGGLIKYLGDGIMAVFGMTNSSSQDLTQDQFSQNAVNAALMILDLIESTDYGEDITIGIGINTGKALVGYVGTKERVEFTAVGDVVNIAFRLQSLARPNRLLVGSETAGCIAGKKSLQDLGVQELAGRTNPLNIFEVIRQ